ncbi:hypothetical protein [Sinorhizobium medicae]|uniref:hypothetical protein n=1 Tax=Sinorhizobium medicae TaxID=110321 RepID=UPI0013E30C67|nr:hypothetical protein [Sinorhizobium medicae]MDX0457990.1 hypothetical protein [Sinorhizobium medicae]MDX0506962.1 hypothetical protein [Sinorhizobium medicae]MDX0593424.1 hypothetical protein [Sinorhizobium medicae]MDX0611903.1 hypothetical protein [Sinorhizobium medicae]MDX0642760.1 hypothetical protein [Sinorhizobium medicae]
MAYAAVLEARKAAEVNKDKIREAVRVGLQLKREAEERKENEAKAQARKVSVHVR